MSIRKILEAKNIMLIVNGNHEPILSEINFSIDRGEFVVLLGSNGSGKSSLINVLSGQVKPTKGFVEINGRKIRNIANKELSKQLLAMSQKLDEKLFLDLTLEENIVIWESRFCKRQRIDAKVVCELIEGLRLKNFLNKKVSAMSGGERQLFLLSLIIAHPPEILFLDEHTSALDPIVAKKVMLITNEVVLKNNITTVMVTHKIEDAMQYGTRIIFLKNGQTAFDLDKKILAPKDISEILSYYN